MKKRTVLLSIAGGILAIATLDAAVNLVTTRASMAGPLDLSHVQTIRVEGAASDIQITARANGPRVAELKGERRGWGAVWHSGWFSDACPVNGSMRIEGQTLTVDVGKAARLFDWSDCTMELTANLAPEAAVIIDQKAARTRLDGDFSMIDVRSDAGDVSFKGHARAVSISGAALRAYLAYEQVTHDETIALSGKMLDATLKFITPTPVSYLVEAVASYIDSALPNTPGAKPAITIRGEMVHARIE
ncbi:MULTISPECIES: hypothetical protein [Alphaproteobacteria]|uniref:Uncharacterized protein n=2 Tax=Alphaproteobacteria TaxID=28211 RepID=A0A512HG00_9HYPH|nr:MULTISPECIES: hypothetical protein [Alphaproteobacteria]GEO84310.1 hypothetical protein RNA01_12420 [Ciceribacter naphthalenivorans]GLR24846.1 hypothetical protein GCM10007920_46400 [Ciceribacter naphthalenivorans]GLT07702.1 hypothetical protein GCM10007926_46400 [Sphingomonas psychrolutea]